MPRKGQRLNKTKSTSATNSGLAEIPQQEPPFPLHQAPLAESGSINDSEPINSQSQSQSKRTRKRDCDWGYIPGVLARRRGESNDDFMTRVFNTLAASTKERKERQRELNRKPFSDAITCDFNPNDQYANQTSSPKSRPCTPYSSTVRSIAPNLSTDKIHQDIDTEPLDINKTSSNIPELEPNQWNDDDETEYENIQSKEELLEKDLRKTVDTKRLYELWVENKYLIGELNTMQDTVRDETFATNIRNLEESSNNATESARKRTPFFLDNPMFDLPPEEQTEAQRTRKSNFTMEYIHTQYLLLHNMSKSYVEQSNNILNHIMDTYASELTALQWQTLMTRLMHAEPIPQMDLNGMWKRSWP
jgi:hypothetical protein